MGELSQENGKKLEKFGYKLFQNLGWKILGQNIEINCTRSSHKNAEGNNKRTHGIDLLFGFYNPFKKRNEAVIVECKNRQWSNYTTANLDLWIEELVNTVECAPNDSNVLQLLGDHTLTTGILMFHSSDDDYDAEKAQKVLKSIKTPTRRQPTILYVADPSKLEKIVSVNDSIEKFKNNTAIDNFRIVYPIINHSDWQGTSVITPEYLFSDYIIFDYKESFSIGSTSTKINKKGIFCFDKINKNSLTYLKDLIKKFQLEAYGDEKTEIEVFLYPDNANDIRHIKNLGNQNEFKSYFKFNLLKNPHISDVDYQ